MGFELKDNGAKFLKLPEPRFKLTFSSCCFQNKILRKKKKSKFDILTVLHIKRTNLPYLYLLLYREGHLFFNFNS
jgi:hypothetical protein